MTKTKLLAIAVAVLALMNIGIVSFFLLSSPEAHRPQQEGPKKQIIEDLHFDQEQIARYEILIHEHRAAIEHLEQQMLQAKNILYGSLATDDTTNESALIAGIANIQQEIEQVHYAHFLAIKKLCRPGQLSAYNELTKKLALYFAPPHPPRRQ